DGLAFAGVEHVAERPGAGRALVSCRVHGRAVITTRTPGGQDPLGARLLVGDIRGGPQAGVPALRFEQAPFALPHGEAARVHVEPEPVRRADRELDLELDFVPRQCRAAEDARGAGADAAPRAVRRPIREQPRFDRSAGFRAQGTVVVHSIRLPFRRLWGIGAVLIQTTTAAIRIASRTGVCPRPVWDDA